MTEKIEIDLLCPNMKCRKCKRIVKDLEKIFKELSIDYQLIITTELDDMLKFDTWLLPSLFINKKLVLVGYIPKYKFLKNRILDFINLLKIK